MIGTLGIPSARNRSVSEMASPTPDMSGTVQSYFRPLVLIFVLKSVADHEIAEARVKLKCMGTVQPFGPRELKIKAEGQRSWNWQMLHTQPNVALKNDEEFTIAGTRYRVMSNAAWSDYGYLMYELVQDYNGNA